MRRTAPVLALVALLGASTVGAEPVKPVPPVGLKTADALVVADMLLYFDEVPGTLLRTRYEGATALVDLRLEQDVARRRGLNQRWSDLLAKHLADAAWAPVVHAEQARLSDVMLVAIDGAWVGSSFQQGQPIKSKALKMLTDPAASPESRAAAASFLQKIEEIRVRGTAKWLATQKTLRLELQGHLVEHYARAWIGRAKMPKDKADLAAFVGKRLAHYEVLLGESAIKAYTAPIQGFVYTPKMFGPP
ncbi:MAG: hypothetical protein JNL79_30295 [Myxococcales bacterium]|nr:hypothetical protein [Myxococcales bacterium]